MIAVKKHGVILEPTDQDFEALAVLNPGVWKSDDGKIHLFYRAVDQNHISTIGYARLQGPTTIAERRNRPVIAPERDIERSGVEDPRITKIGETFYLTYVAHDGKNAVTAYATSQDLKTFERKGIISPRITYHEVKEMFHDACFGNRCLKDAYYLFAAYYEEHAGADVLLWGKDMMLFPKKINGKFAMFLRTLPDIQIVFFENFSDLNNPEFWREYFKKLPEFVVLENTHWFENRHIGGGAPPIELPEGWLTIFHTAEETNKGRVYRACAALLDKENPLRVLGRLHEPLFGPDEQWEQTGEVHNVVFPTGTARFDDELYIYYGAADKRIAVASVSIRELVRELLDPTKHHGAQ